MHCIGCGSPISWNGKGMFSYTCPCGSTTLINEETGQLHPVGSIAMQILTKNPVTHLDSIVGESNYTSPEKEQLIKELEFMGFIWMKDCKQCQGDGTLKRKQERETYLAVREAEFIARLKEG